MLQWNYNFHLLTAFGRGRIIEMPEFAIIELESKTNLEEQKNVSNAF